MPECSKSSPRRQQARQLAALGLMAGALLLPVQWSSAEPALQTDPREIYTGDAPHWLRAVGKLRVPGSTYAEGRRSHLLEDCSATLVTGNSSGDADTIVTAWHCLEHYNDLSRPILFALVAGQSGELVREAYRLDDGGGMHADWAILRLRAPIAAAQVSALPIHPGRATPPATITMAGYSRDPASGARATQLTYHANCQITAADATTSDSNCLAYKGASGGAVVQVSGTGIALFSGVISEGDSAGMSRFVPVAVFHRTLARHLR